jgi:hypothetical protein
MTRPGDATMTKAAFEQLSEFRYQMRRFQRFSERAARSHGVTPLQYLLLLHTRMEWWLSSHAANHGDLFKDVRANAMAER